MEEHKMLKPYFSQAADRLNERIDRLIIGTMQLTDPNAAGIMAQSLDGSSSL